MSKLIPTTKQIKSTAIDSVEVLGGLIAAHAIRTQIKAEKKWINPLAAFISAYINATTTNSHAKMLSLAGIGYFGLRTLNDLKSKAVEGLEGVAGMEGIREVLNKIVPSLGDAETEYLTGNELADAEEELLGLLGNEGYTPFTEVASSNQDIAGL